LKVWMEENFQRYKWDILALLLLLLLPFVSNFNVFYAIGPFPQIYPLNNDFVVSYNFLSLSTHFLSEGEIGLWFQGTGFGWPYFSYSLSGLLYPPTIILSKFNDIQHGFAFASFPYYLLITKGLTSCFFFFLMRSFKINRWGATVGAIAWGFNLRLDDIVRSPGAAHSIMWLPLLILAAVKVMENPDKRYVGYLALVFAMIFFANYPPNFIISMAFMGLLFSFCLLRKYLTSNRETCDRAIPNMLLAVVLGICLVSVQLLSELEFSSYFNRRGGLPFSGTMIYRCTPTQTVLGYFFPAVAYTERDHYLGILPLLLAAVGLLSRDKRYRFKNVLIFTLILTAIYSTKSIISHPLQKFLYDYVPLFNSLRCPGRFLILNMFCLSLLAAYGMDALTNPNATRENVRRRASVIAAILLLGFTAAWFIPKLNNLTETDRNAFLMLAVASSAVMALLFLPAKGRNRLVLYLAVCLTIVDLSYATYWKQKNPNARHHYYTERNPDIKGPKSLISNHLNERYFHVPDREMERMGRIDSLINQPLLFVDSALPSFAAPFNEYGYEGSLLDINYLFIKIRDSWRARSILNTRFDVEYFLPRAYVVYRLERLSHDKIIEEMVSPRFDPLNKSYIEEELPEVFGELLTGRNDIAPNEAGRLAQITEETKTVIYENTLVEIETDIPQPGFLCLSDAFYPGWKAYVDGEPVKIYRANYAFRGVPVPEGKHTITFVYRPPRFYIGLLISGAALLVILFILVKGRRYSEAIGITLVCLFCYGPLAWSRTRAETARPRESITAYNVQTVEGKVVSARPRRSRTAEARVHIEEDGIYDLLLKSPPQFYRLNIDNEFAARIFNTGSESPAPQEDWWEVQAILKLEKGNHKIEFVPINPTRRMMPVFNKLILKPGERSVYHVEAIRIDRSFQVRQLKLVKH